MNAAIYLQISFFSFFFLLIFLHVALFSCFLLFFLFFPRRSVPLIVACLFLFFLSTSFTSSIFLGPFRWCRVVMLKTAVYGNQVRFESLKNSAGTCTKLIYVAYIYILDTYRRNDNRRSNKRRMIKTQEDFFRKIFTSHFIARVRKGCSRFACERVLETEYKLHILTPLLWPSRCVFIVLLMLGSTPSGGFREPPRSGVAFPTTSGL